MTHNYPFAATIEAKKNQRVLANVFPSSFPIFFLVGFLPHEQRAR